jgi:hypothetical protein
MANVSTRDPFRAQRTHLNDDFSQDPVVEEKENISSAVCLADSSKELPNPSLGVQSSSINNQPSVAAYDKCMHWVSAVSTLELDQPTLESTQQIGNAADDLDFSLLIPDQDWTSKDFCKLKVADLREELQMRNLATSGLKEELITRLLASYCKDNCLVGRDVLPLMGMRVRHVNGPNHGSSKGMGGMIEFIPGRGAFRSDERSVSVRWDADRTDVRGPYYTGEPCDRGSGIGTPKFDLLCLDLNPILIQRIEERTATVPDVPAALNDVNKNESSPVLVEEMVCLQESCKSPQVFDCIEPSIIDKEPAESIEEPNILENNPSCKVETDTCVSVSILEHDDLPKRASADSRKRSHDG